MILVSLGTQDKSFERLLSEVDNLAKRKIIDDRIVVQAGFTKFKSDSMEVFDYLSIDEFNELLNECDLLISHGGVGTIMSALKLNKTIIGCARLKEFKEHTNDHQIQILEEFDKQGYLLYCKDINKLEEYYIKSKDFKPKRFKSNTDNIIKLIEDFININ